jgi:hypothetical protein
LYSNSLNLALTGKPDPDLHQNALSSPLSKYFQFDGITEYLEDFVTLIDTPQLDSMDIIFINELDFEIQRLAQFINRTLKLAERDETHVEFNGPSARIVSGTLQIYIDGGELDRCLSSVSQFGSYSITFTVKDFYIACQPSHTFWIEYTLWLQLLLPFTAVKNLYLCKAFAPSLAATLQELVGDRMTEVLPSLQNIFVDELEPFEKNIGQFIVARQLSGHPIAISIWTEEGKARRAELLERQTDLLVDPMY